MNPGNNINMNGVLRVILSRKEVRKYLADKDLKENVPQMASMVKMPATGKHIRIHLTKLQEPKTTTHQNQAKENKSHSNKGPIDKVQSKYVPDKNISGNKQKMRINSLKFKICVNNWIPKQIQD